MHLVVGLAEALKEGLAEPEPAAQGWQAAGGKNRCQEKLHG